MNNQDLFNLQEAYLGIYERFVPPTKEKAERIKDFLDQAGDESASNAEKLRAARRELAAAAADPTKIKPDTKKLRRRTTNLAKRAKWAADALAPQNYIRPRNRKTSDLVFLSRNNPNSPANNIRDFIRKEEYDIVVPYLLDEGYAKTLQGAEAIMVNMSEDWRDSILEAHPLDVERKLIQRLIRTGIPFSQRINLNLKPKPKNRTVGN